MKYLFSIFVITILFLGCKKEDVAVEEGTYTGTFKVVYSSGSYGPGTYSGTTTVVLKDSRFTCAGNPNRIPAGGSGTYLIAKGKINFADENFWTADFDWGLILNGQYTYSFDGKKLIFSKGDKNGTYYEYDLEKK